MIPRQMVGALTALVTFAPLIATRLARAQDSTRHTIILPASLQAPDSIEQWRRGPAHDFGRAELGLAYHYASRDTSEKSFATLYLYPVPPDLRGATADSVIAAEVGAFRQALRIEQQRGKYDSYEVPIDERDSIAVASHTYRGWHILFVYRHGDTIALSDFELYVVGDALVKVRYDMSADDFGRGKLTSFPHRLAASAVRTP